MSAALSALLRSSRLFKTNIDRFDDHHPGLNGLYGGQLQPLLAQRAERAAAAVDEEGLRRVPAAGQRRAIIPNPDKWANPGWHGKRRHRWCRLCFVFTQCSVLHLMGFRQVRHQAFSCVQCRADLYVICALGQT